MQIIGLRVVSLLVKLIYDKLLRLSPSSKQMYTKGDILNILNVDAEEVFEAILILMQSFALPLRIMVNCYYLYHFLGSSGLVVLPVVTFLAILYYTVSKVCTRFQRDQMNWKNKRIKQLTECLHSIKIIKLYSWEGPFIDTINNIRRKELSLLYIASYLETIIIFFTWLAPHFMTFLILIFYMEINTDHNLDAVKIFIPIMVFNLLRLPLMFLPQAIGKLSRAQVALQRIRSFLSINELINVQYPRSKVKMSTNISVHMKNANFGWNKTTESTLKDLNFSITKGSLTAIVGSVGSGKSSLLFALTGQMYHLGGEFWVQGLVAYVPQEAWILNDTIKNNIVFTSNQDDIRYARVVEACELRSDISLLKAGDQTVIGEKGITLSGGQKQRISIARAVYSNQDVYLFDDPFSALDATICGCLFRQIFGPQGMLKDKTRIVVTHRLEFLSLFDFIIYIKNGKIVKIGTYDEMKNSALVSLDLTQSVQCNQPESRQKEVMITSNDIKMNYLIDNEPVDYQKVGWSLYHQYFKLLGYCSLITLVIFNLFFNSVEIGSHLWLKIWSDVEPEAQRKQKSYYTMIYACFVFGQLFRVLIMSLLTFRSCLKTAAIIHNKLLTAVFGTKMFFFDITPISRIVARFSRDLGSIDKDIPLSLLLIIDAATFTPLGFGILLINSFYIAIVAFVIILAYYFLYVSVKGQLNSLCLQLYFNFPELL